MAKAVFITKPGSGYDDVREERYHFPKNYLSRAKETIGDFILYYEPRRGKGRLSYVAVARVKDIVPDQRSPDHFYALVTDFVEFDHPVGLSNDLGLFESSLVGQGPGGYSGNTRNAVRIIKDDEFEAILKAGFETQAVSPSALGPGRGLAEEPTPFERPIVETIVRRPFRDEAFARHVKDAYLATCALTGLSMRNGGGRTEVDAAHIKPVGDGHNGPDSVRNGLALSKTVHWMFDRGLLSIDSDYKILTARSLVPEPIRRLLNPDGAIRIPDAEHLRPHASFLEYHRNNIFKESRA